MADRTFEVNITTAVQAPYAIKKAGYAGEHNATAIQINLPADYIGGFTYSLDLMTGAGEAYPYPLVLIDGDDFLYFELSKPLTDKGALDFQLKITETATGMVVKTRVINLQIIGRDVSAYAVGSAADTTEESLFALYNPHRWISVQSEEPTSPSCFIWIDPDAEGIVTTPDEVFSGVIGVSGMLKGNGVGAIESAVPKTDYTPGLSGITPGLLKSDAAGTISSATPGTDYAPGYKGIISTGADADNIKEPGIYAVNPPAGGAQIPNLPNTNYGIVKVVLCTGSFIEQEYMDYFGRRFQRFYDMYQDEWKPWLQVITNATPDVVLFSDGSSETTGQAGAHFALSQSMQNFKSLTFYIIAHGHVKLLTVPVYAFNAGDNVSWTAARIDATGQGISHYALSVGRSNDKLIRISGVAVWEWNGVAGTGPARSDYQNGFYIYRVTGSYS